MFIPVTGPDVVLITLSFGLWIGFSVTIKPAPFKGFDIQSIFQDKTNMLVIGLHQVFTVICCWQTFLEDHDSENRRLSDNRLMDYREMGNDRYQVFRLFRSRCF